MPSIIASAIGAAGAIGGGILNSSATKSAANTEANAANQASQTQLGIYNNTVSNLAPYLSTGTSALSQLSQLLGIGGPNGVGSTNGVGPNNSALYSALQNYPGYQFSLQQGLDAVNQSGAARGILNSGATIKNATQYGQGLAQSTLGSYLSQLQGLATTGENAGAITGSQGVSTGANVGNSLIAGGNATGSGQLGSSLALTGGINNALNSSLQAYLSTQGNYNPSGGFGTGFGTPGFTPGYDPSIANIS